MSQRIKAAKRRHVIEMIAVMLGYLAVVFIVTRFDDQLTNKAALTALAFAPIIPMAVAFILFIRVYRQMDEREQRINTTAAGVALMISILAATAAGFLESFGVFAIEDGLIWFSAFLIAAWAAARLAIGGFD